MCLLPPCSFLFIPVIAVSVSSSSVQSLISVFAFFYVYLVFFRCFSLSDLNVFLSLAFLFPIISRPLFFIFFSFVLSSLLFLSSVSLFISLSSLWIHFFFSFILLSWTTSASFLFPFYSSSDSTFSLFFSRAFLCLHLISLTLPSSTFFSPLLPLLVVPHDLGRCYFPCGERSPETHRRAAAVLQPPRIKAGKGAKLLNSASFFLTSTQVQHFPSTETRFSHYVGFFSLFCFRHFSFFDIKTFRRK